MTVRQEIEGKPERAYTADSDHAEARLKCPGLKRAPAERLAQLLGERLETRKE